MSTSLYLDAEMADRYQIIGFTAQDVETAKTIYKIFDPLLDRQDREDWSVLYAAYNAALDATPSVRLAHEHECGSLGGTSAVFHLLPEDTRPKEERDSTGSTTDPLLCARILHAFANSRVNYPPMAGIVDRALAALRSGHLKGLYWA